MTVPRPLKYHDTDLLDRSADLLWRDGCDAVSIRDLEIALDLKAPSIYRRFHSRDELIARSVDRYVDRVVAARVRRHLGGVEDPVDGLRAFFTSALEPAAGEALPRGCLLTLTAGQAAGAVPAVGDAVAAGMATVERALRAQVGRAADQGRTAPGSDPDALSTALLLAFEGLLVLARTGRSGLSAAVDELFAATFPCRPATTTPDRTTPAETTREDPHP